MRVLEQRDFRNLLFGQAASTIGDRIVFVALALYVTDIGSPTDVGIVLAVGSPACDAGPGRCAGGA